MKRWAVLLLGAVVTIAPGHGEPVVNSFGGVLLPAEKTSIELRDLSILLEQRGERMWVEEEYEFFNPEFEKDLTVGFLTLPHIPADRQLDTHLEPNIETLIAELNGKPVSFDAKPIVETAFQREIKEISELGCVYYATIRFQRGRNALRLSCGYRPSRGSEGVDGQTYFPFTVTPAGL